MTIKRNPVFRIWVPGIPKSFQRKGPKTRYIQKIQEATRKHVPYPVKSGRIDIEIFFVALRFMRADVDNIIKPILDALIDIVYFNDNQVRSIRAVAISPDEINSFPNADIKAMDRLYKGKEFLIDIYNQMGIVGPGNEPSTE
ncbi:MAG: RusA family crossover junction endodeoxyribonuclease [Candidatus Hodarchaeota archaeon]